MEGKVEINVEDYNKLLEAQRLMMAVDDAVVNHVLKKNEKLYLFRKEQQHHNDDWKRYSAYDSGWGTLFCITADKQREELEELYKEKVGEVNRLKYELEKSRENEKCSTDKYLEQENNDLRNQIVIMNDQLRKGEMAVETYNADCRSLKDKNAGLTIKISQLEKELKDYHSSWLYKLKKMFS